MPEALTSKQGFCSRIMNSGFGESARKQWGAGGVWESTFLKMPVRGAPHHCGGGRAAGRGSAAGALGRGAAVWWAVQGRGAGGL